MNKVQGRVNVVYFYMNVKPSSTYGLDSGFL